MSISIRKSRADGIRKLVGGGLYPSISAAMDHAVEALLDQVAEQDEWWTETVRRCAAAEANPESLLDADTFFEGVRKDIARRKKHLHAK